MVLGRGETGGSPHQPSAPAGSVRQPASRRSGPSELVNGQGTGDDTGFPRILRLQRRPPQSEEKKKERKPEMLPKDFRH